MDSTITSLSQRIATYEVVCERFGFLIKLPTIIPEELDAAAKSLTSLYPEDLESSLSLELLQLAKRSELYKRLDEESMEAFLYRIIIENDLRSTFVNAEIILCIYLSMMVTNCSGERSFSKMKIIKNRLRTSMGQERLTGLMILSIESDIVRDLSFENLIDIFARKKSRKVHLG